MTKLRSLNIWWKSISDLTAKPVDCTKYESGISFVFDGVSRKNHCH